MLSQFQDPYFIEKFNENIESQKQPIKCYSKNGFIKTYPSVHSAGRELNLIPTNICKVLKGKYKTCGGYTFCYINEDITDEELTKRYTLENHGKRKSKYRPVYLVDNNDNVIHLYNSLLEASNDNGNIDSSSIAKVCNGKLKTTHGLRFKYA